MNIDIMLTVKGGSPLPPSILVSTDRSEVTADSFPWMDILKVFVSNDGPNSLTLNDVRAFCSHPSVLLTSLSNEIGVIAAGAIHAINIHVEALMPIPIGTNISIQLLGTVS